MSDEVVKEIALRTLTGKGKTLVSSAYDRLQSAMPGFKRRRAQLEMIAGAARALGTTHGVAVIEAGTGTGKSLSYLVAGIPLALDAGMKLVLSTGTVALQEQLFNRDIPMFLKSTGISAKVALGKGRQRYLCPRNLADLAGSGPAAPQAALEGIEELAAGWPRPPTAEQVELVGKMVQQFDGGKWTGDLDAFDTLPQDLQRLVTTTRGGCMGRRCPFAKECPALRARQALRDADVVVANHSLVLADLLFSTDDGKTGTILADPTSSLYVFDEAHRLPNNAIEAAAASVALDAMHPRLKKLRKVASATIHVARNGDRSTASATEQIGPAIESLGPQVAMLQSMLEAEWICNPLDREKHWRAPHGVIPEHWALQASNIAGTLRTLRKGFVALRSGVRKSELDEKSRDRLLKEIGIQLEQIEADLELFSSWSLAPSRGSPDAPQAKWMSRSEAGHLLLHAAPVDAAAVLDGVLWSVADSVLLTSATMASGQDFTAFATSIGLPANAELMKLNSPFDLEKQAVLQVPWLEAAPTDHDAHCQAVARWLDSELDWSQGTLVLFTSRRRLTDTFELLPEARKPLVLSQTAMPKQRLLDAHASAIKAGRGSVILGMAGLGEGLDLAGDLLRNVVVTSLPFAVPSDPIGATLAEWYEENGRNPFQEIAIPEAIRVLTQYCGRLIRTVTDTGRVVILDRRLIEKSYGKKILAALPPFRREIGRRGVGDRR